ncbi:MAG: hypothetical protein ITG00_07275 [Flavobacterium sp.]|nr:hypothetical protein [Flavobacterium sp.]
MTLTDYTFILNKPDAINNRQTAALEKIVDEFPYFQSARALRLKGLYNDDSFKYNYALKITAAHTTDRSVLFDFITSDSFSAVQRKLYEEKLLALHDIPVASSEVVQGELPKKPLNSLELSILTSIQESGSEELDIPKPQPPTSLPETAHHQIESHTNSEEQNLEIGKPLEFAKSEKHSFEEWLQLSRLKAIEREADIESESPTENQIDEVKQKKNYLIDRFIESNPKIPTLKSEQTLPPTTLISETDQSYLMTETLARVYLEQKKYSKAIQAYEILILKYPEKSSFFADRILDIKHLQQNNNNR